MVPPVVVTVLESPSTTPRPKDLPWATPHLPAWKVRGAASSHLVEGPGSSHILLVPIPGHSVPCQCLHSLTSSLTTLRNGDPCSSLARGIN